MVCLLVQPIQSVLHILEADVGVHVDYKQEKSSGLVKNGLTCKSYGLIQLAQFCKRQGAFLTNFAKDCSCQAAGKPLISTQNSARGDSLPRLGRIYGTYRGVIVCKTFTKMHLCGADCRLSKPDVLSSPRRDDPHS